MQRLRMTLRFIMIVVLLIGVAAIAPLHGAEPPTPLSGIFFNIPADAGGTAIGAIGQDGQNVTGQLNFTNYPRAARLCGAGAFAGIRTTDPFTLTFTSQDLDPGCGFDWTSVFTLTSHLETNPMHFWGSYTNKNGPQSSISEYPGVFELWESGTEPPVTTYVGTFTNMTIGHSGVLLMSLGVGQQLVFGTMDFSNHPGEQLLCGAGQFAGRVGNELTWTFVSTETAPGCLTGSTFSVTASRSTDGQVVTGTYHSGGYSGTFTVSRAQQVALPLIRR